MEKPRVVLACIGATLALFVLVTAPIVHADDETSVPYPEGYRGWTFLHGSVVPASAGGFGKTPCEKPCTNGIFYFYANEPAMKGLQSGSYEDGAIIAEELLELRIGEKGGGGEGRRALVAVMVKDSKRYAATGGWGYGSFGESGKINTLDVKAQQQCHQCHVAQKDRGYVFTRYTAR